MASRVKSESGAYMSQYDTEVEKRLKALEADVKKLKEAVASLSQKAAAPVTSAPAEGLEHKVAVLEGVLKLVEPNFDKLSKKF
tara:strand:+ start:1942 stop:2190 length:249 start_codon:yes stop_codon:yes gene_type:complete